MSWRAAPFPRRCRWSKSAPIISGTEASSPILRCNISSTRTTRSTLSSSRSICSARAACFRATSRMSWRVTRTSCIPHARATTPTSIDGFITWKVRLSAALRKISDDRLSDDERRLRDELATLPEITILQLIYQQKAYEGHAKDYEFSGTSMREHWQSGYEDTKRTLKKQEWLRMPVEGAGIVVHDIHRESDR